MQYYSAKKTKTQTDTNRESLLYGKATHEMLVKQTPASKFKVRLVCMLY